MNLKSWVVKKVNREESLAIAQEYDIPSVLAMLLEQRTGGAREEIENIIVDDGFSESPFELIDMDKAVHRIQMAIDNFERIAVYGDYDADGITSTSIMYEYLRDRDADVMYYIPKREGEGYGMNEKAIEYLNSYEVKLIITVDNGIASVKEVELANSLGIDVIVTDHHQPPEVLPNAYAVVDPHRKDCPSYFKDYCGAGIALKLILALEFDFGDEEEVFERFADLATLGTIADIVPLTGENRTIVKKGLANLCESERLGINTILEKASVTNINSTSVAFSIVPRINATGRMGVPDRAVRLLTSEDEEDALLIAEDVCKDNDARKEVELEIFNEAVAKIENDHKIKYGRVLVVDGENWHAGVIGIVASRLLEKYGKPCIVISVNGDEGVGSGRSFDGFSLFEAISNSSQSLSRFGGHHMAAGLSVTKENIEKFRNDINEYARINFETMPLPKVYVDLKIQPATLSVDIPDQYSVLEPFGKDNELPVFGLFGMELANITPVGANKNHLRLNFIRDGKSFTCMMFGCTAQRFEYGIGNKLDLAVTLDVNYFRAEKSLTIIIKDIKPSDIDIDKQAHSKSVYEKFMRNESLTKQEAEVVLPNRDDIAGVYRFLMAKKDEDLSVMKILCGIQSAEKNIGKIMFSIMSLKECNLIKIDGEEFMRVSIVPTKTKVDILNSDILKKLRNFA